MQVNYGIVFSTAEYTVYSHVYVNRVTWEKYHLMFILSFLS